MSNQKKAAVKLGRKPRAAGVRMVKIGISIQEPLRDALDLIARDRKTSLSQTIEFLIDEVCKTYRIDGQSPLTLAEPLDEPTLDDQVRSHLASTVYFTDLDNPDYLSHRGAALKRLLKMPARLRKPFESYFVELANLPGMEQTDERLIALEQSAEMMHRDGITIDHAKRVWFEMNSTQ